MIVSMGWYDAEPVVEASDLYEKLMPTSVPLLVRGFHSVPALFPARARDSVLQ